MKKITETFQRFFHGEKVGDPVFRYSNRGHSVTLRPVSGRRAGSLSFSEHGEHAALILEAHELTQLKFAIDKILTTEQRNQK